MAKFCKNCIKREMGLKKGDKYYEDWLVQNESICEGCGYNYLKNEQEGQP